MPANNSSNRIARSFLIGLCTFSVACSEPANQPDTNNAHPQASQQTKAFEGKFIKATQVPNSSQERQALLKQLKQQNDAKAQRLALFVKYTEMTNTAIEKDTLEQLLADIDTQLKANSDDHELRALLGSATSLKATFYLDDVGQTNLLAKKGGRQLDRAVKKAPNHLGVRMYRGITYAEMPAFLGKARFAKQDFETIKAAINADPATNGSKNDDFIAMINYYHAMALIKDNQKDQGQALLNQVIQSQKTPWVAKAKTLLKEAS